MSKKDFKGVRIEYQFAAIPIEVLRSAEWIALPPNACKLVFALVSQYTGKNNGRLCVAWEAMQPRGFKSKHTLIAAKRALLECSFVVHTRMGKKPRTADWVAFTWWRLDWEKSMDIPARGFPYLNFVQLHVTKLGDPSKTLREVQKLHATIKKGLPGGAETALMEAA